MLKQQAYIDSFEYITVLIDKAEYVDGKRFFLLRNRKKTPLETLYHHADGPYHKYILKNIPEIELHLDYTIVDEINNKCRLQSGSIIRTKEFDDKFKYDGPLGYEYHKTYSIFRVWSPVCKEIRLEIIKDNGSEFYDYKYTNKSGVWECAVFEDLEYAKYVLHARVHDKFSRILDPYAIASGANAEYNYVIDPEKLYKQETPIPAFSGDITDAIIYEASIRDFTYNLEDGKASTFLGLSDNGKTNSGLNKGLNYIRDLGATHLQLLPTFDFEGVDDKDKDTEYNWGYNPLQYLVPCGWYSENPDDPYSRVNELLMLIDECHKKGLRVVMDVVFNHVYRWEDFAFDHLVPGYFFRVELDGSLSNATGCGNVIATERYMTSKYIVEALKFYAKYYKVSGFRFDLMGLIDINTLNKAHEELDKIHKGIILYGEGWNMNNPLPDEQRAHMYNHYKMPAYAFFNDKYRDSLRGNQWDSSRGFALGSPYSIFDISHLLSGSCIDFFKFYSPKQTINYVECHDNYTFFDYAKKVGLSDKEAYDASRLALQMIIVSQGVPFIHAGQEFFRTKNGIENSYNASDNVNKFDYERREMFVDNVLAIKDLISIRKEYEIFRHKTSKDIYNRVHILEGLSDYHTIALMLEDHNFDLILFVKNNYESRLIPLKLEMIYDSHKRMSETKHEFIINTPGVYIFKKEKHVW